MRVRQFELRDHECSIDCPCGHHAANHGGAGNDGSLNLHRGPHDDNDPGEWRHHGARRGLLDRGLYRNR